MVFFFRIFMKIRNLHKLKFLLPSLPIQQSAVEYNMVAYRSRRGDVYSNRLILIYVRLSVRRLNVFGAITCFPYHIHLWTLIYVQLFSQGWSLFILGSNPQRSMSRCFEKGNGFSTITCSLYYLSVWKLWQGLPLNDGWSLLIFGPNGQRIRSQCFVIRERFPL